MPSPFPGMNPYLERAEVWETFHQQFCTRCLEALVPQVRPRYRVKLGEHLYLQDESEDGRLIGLADVSLTDSERPGGSSGGTGVLTAPVEGRVAVREIGRSTFLEILDREDDRLVTVIELLSPTNKRTGPHRDRYVAKRDDVFVSEVHFVEIDLLRGGRRPPVQQLPPCDYYALVSRAEARPVVGLWPMGVRDPLPILPIPVRDPHAAAQLDLQQLLHATYDLGGYEDYIYRATPSPRLSGEDAVWAAQCVPAQP